MVDVSTPSSPAVLGSAVFSAATLGNPTSVFVKGSLAFVTALISNALVVVDVSGTLSPASRSDTARRRTSPQS